MGIKMRQATAKNLRRQITNVAETRGFPVKLANRRLKREYNRTPRTEREAFTIFENRHASN